MKRMQTKCLAMAVVAAWLLSPVLAAKAPEALETVTVPLSKASQPAWVEAHVMFGSITVEAYAGREVVVETFLRGKSLQSKIEKKIEEAELDELKKEKKPTRDISGLRKIPIANTGLTIEEKDNRVSIRVDSWKQTVDLKIKVPVNTSLDLKCQSNGDIKVTGVTGEMDVNNLNGPIHLTGVTGTVLAHTLNGEIVATLTRVNPDKPMSFSTLNGDIDVTLPSSIRNNVRVESRGDIYSDFDIKLQKEPVKKVDNGRHKGGTFRVHITQGVFGTINGGGPEISFKNFNGDIYIRRK